MSHDIFASQDFDGDNASTDSLTEVAAIIAEFEDDPNGAVLDNFSPRSGCCYTLVRAISARINQNFDAWPSEELREAHHTFIGKPVFVNHNNHDPDRARGRVVASRYVDAGENDRYVQVLQEVEATRFPLLAKELMEGGLDSVSMGAEAREVECSVCSNISTSPFDACEHIPMKGASLRTANGEETLVYEICRKISFFELSYVFEPADETAVASNVLVANRKAFNDVEAPAKVDTLHPEEDEKSSDDWQEYVDDPNVIDTIDVLDEPDLGLNQELERPDDELPEGFEEFEGIEDEIEANEEAEAELAQDARERSQEKADEEAERNQEQFEPAPPEDESDLDPESDEDWEEEDDGAGGSTHRFKGGSVEAMVADDYGTWNMWVEKNGQLIASDSYSNFSEAKAAAVDVAKAYTKERKMSRNSTRQSSRKQAQTGQFQEVDGGAEGFNGSRVWVYWPMFASGRGLVVDEDAQGHTIMWMIEDPSGRFIRTEFADSVPEAMQAVDDYYHGVTARKTITDRKSKESKMASYRSASVDEFRSWVEGSGISTRNVNKEGGGFSFSSHAGQVQVYSTNDGSVAVQVGNGAPVTFPKGQKQKIRKEISRFEPAKLFANRKKATFEEYRELLLDYGATDDVNTATVPGLQSTFTSLIDLLEEGGEDASELKNALEDLKFDSGLPHGAQASRTSRRRTADIAADDQEFKDYVGDLMYPPTTPEELDVVFFDDFLVTERPDLDQDSLDYIADMIVDFPESYYVSHTPTYSSRRNGKPRISRTKNRDTSRRSNRMAPQRRRRIGDNNKQTPLLEETGIARTPAEEPAVDPEEGGDAPNNSESDRVKSARRALAREMARDRARKARRRQAASDLYDEFEAWANGLGEDPSDPLIKQEYADMEGVSVDDLKAPDGVPSRPDLHNAKRRKARRRQAAPVGADLSGASVKREDLFESFPATTMTARIRKRFANWVRENYGASLRQASSQGELRSWARAFSKESGIEISRLHAAIKRDIQAFRTAEDKDDMPDFIKEKVESDDDNPSKEDVEEADEKKEARRRAALRRRRAAQQAQARRGRGRTRTTRRRRTADDKLDLAAPGDRVNVEKPTSGTTDADAEASQFDRADFDNNSGKGLENPDTTGTPGLPGGPSVNDLTRSSARASGLQAVKLAEAMIAVGLIEGSSESKFKAAAQFEKMSRDIVLDRTALLEKVATKQGRRSSNQKSAGNRGASLNSAVPPNMTGMARSSAPQTREASSANDSDLFF